MEQEAQQQGGLRMVLVMGLVGLIASILLVGTYQLTAPRIAVNRAAYLERAVLDVLPGAISRRAFLVRGETLQHTDVAGEKDRRLFAGYDEMGALVGIAVEAQGQGFQDVLRILYGYVPDCACIVGMKVLESKETPGLGDKIEKDAAFLTNFEALDVTLAPNGEDLRNTVTLVKPGTKNQPWQIEAISGATVSSRAITQIIDASAAEFIPLIHKNLDVLRAQP